jgi:hypothetical protein
MPNSHKRSSSQLSDKYIRIIYNDAPQYVVGCPGPDKVQYPYWCPYDKFMKILQKYAIGQEEYSSQCKLGKE